MGVPGYEYMILKINFLLGEKEFNATVLYPFMDKDIDFKYIYDFYTKNRDYNLDITVYGSFYFASMETYFANRKEN